jgi:hypothetical protein
MAMQSVVHVWPGWTGTLLADGAKYRLTWGEWCVRQRQRSQRQRARNATPSPGRREVAARAFLAWFDAAANGSDTNAPPFDDRELAVRGFMHNFEEVAALLDQFSGAELTRLRLLRKRHRHLEAGADGRAG